MTLRRVGIGLGLAVAIVSVVVWIASMWAITWRSGGRTAVVIREGVVTAHTKGTYTRQGWSCVGLWFGTSRPFEMLWWPYDGKLWEWYRMSSGMVVWSASVPLWAPTLAGLVVAAGAYWRGRGEKVGKCACGYDLAGLTGRGVCPECGRECVRG